MIGRTYTGLYGGPKHYQWLGGLIQACAVVPNTTNDWKDLYRLVWWSQTLPMIGRLVRWQPAFHTWHICVKGFTKNVLYWLDFFPWKKKVGVAGSCWLWPFMGGRGGEKNQRWLLTMFMAWVCSSKVVKSTQTDKIQMSKMYIIWPTKKNKNFFFNRHTQKLSQYRMG